MEKEKTVVQNISVWAVSEKCRAAHKNKTDIYEAIMAGALVPEPRDGRRDWRVSEPELDRWLEVANG